MSSLLTQSQDPAPVLYLKPRRALRASPALDELYEMLSSLMDRIQPKTRSISLASSEVSWRCGHQQNPETLTRSKEWDGCCERSSREREETSYQLSAFRMAAVQIWQQKHDDVTQQVRNQQMQSERLLRGPLLRSYVGVELVQWLLEQCVSVQCRSMAVRVWQVLMELGILHSVDQRLVFEDSNSYYQFSFEECEAQACEFRNEDEWQNGVRLLLQLVPYVQFRV
ncbi:hypothetical protein DNTS_021712, partial [Danionella cerebrum]